MHSYLNQQTQSIRQISDLRFGIPVIIGTDSQNALIFSFVPGSCHIKLLAGNPKITKFWSLYKEE